MDKVSLIIACKNEEPNIERVLVSLEKQSVKPSEVVIVDDASTDKTYEIIKKIVENNDNWVVHHRKKSDERYISIVIAMKIASNLLKEDFDFLMVLDGDTILEPLYIEKILQKFHSEPELGIAGGFIQMPKKTHKQNKELSEANLVFGSNRVYSRKCWYEINESKIMNVKTVAWDPEHVARAKIRNYEVKRFDDIFSESIRLPSLELSSFSKGILRYQFGNGFWTILISSIINANLPFLIGYFVAWFSKKPKIDNDYYIKKMRKQHDSEYIRKIRSKLKLK